MSTAVELAGFACWVAAAFIWQSVRLQIVTGLLTSGAVFLLIGYALDDRAAAFAISRCAAPVRRRVAALKQRRKERREHSALSRAARG